MVISRIHQIWRSILTTTALLLFALSVHAQDGRFIGAWAGPQYISINNTSDHYRGDINYKTSFSSAAGLTYLNQSGITGFRSGLVYSRQGQSYTGHFRENGGRRSFSSTVTLQYIKLPVMLNFRSLSNEAETINLDVYTGFQLGYLITAGMESSPSVSDPPDNAPEVKDLFNNLDFTFASGAILNFWLNENTGIILGLRMDRSIINIENLDYDFGESVPAEYHFPVSTKKTDIPTPDDYEIRRSGRNLTFSLQLGLQIRIGEE